MITRIAAAIAALTFIHGAERSGEDAATLAASARDAAPAAALQLCAGHAQTCGRLVGSVARSAGEGLAILPASSRNGAANARPIETYPLPPPRPAPRRQG
jgi:hypothetical protein